MEKAEANNTKCGNCRYLKIKTRRRGTVNEILEPWCDKYYRYIPDYWKTGIWNGEKLSICTYLEDKK